MPIVIPICIIRIVVLWRTDRPSVRIVRCTPCGTQAGVRIGPNSGDPAGGPGTLDPKGCLGSKQGYWQHTAPSSSTHSSRKLLRVQGLQPLHKEIRIVRRIYYSSLLLMSRQTRTKATAQMAVGYSVSMQSFSHFSA